MHKEMGGGSFIAGIKRIMSPNDELDAEMALGTLAVPAVHQDIALIMTLTLVHEIVRHLTAQVHFLDVQGCRIEVSLRLLPPEPLEPAACMRPPRAEPALQGIWGCNAGCLAQRRHPGPHKHPCQQGGNWPGGRAGLRNLVSLSASRKLSEAAGASLGATWVAGAGLSMRFATQRRLGPRTEAAFAWVLGPASEGGVALSVAHRRERFHFSAKLEVGAHVTAPVDLQG